MHLPPDRDPPAELLRVVPGPVRLSELLAMVSPAVRRELLRRLRPYWRLPAVPGQPTILAPRCAGEIIALPTLTCDGRSSTLRETDRLLTLDAEGVWHVRAASARAYRTVHARWLARHHAAVTPAMLAANLVTEAELQAAKRAASRRTRKLRRAGRP